MRMLWLTCTLLSVRMKSSEFFTLCVNFPRCGLQQTGLVFSKSVGGSPSGADDVPQRDSHLACMYFREPI